MLDFSKFQGDTRFFPFFEEISKIPRGSGNTEKIADYLEDFARARGLFCYRDGYNNIVIKKPHTAGYESAPTVILQGHTDMVIARDKDYGGNIEKDGVCLYIDGDFLRARDTTLGADDGIAVAYMLALLNSEDIPHPAIEAVFTSDEEIGLIGAAGLDASALSGKTMINLDSDEEGVLIAGCAGGLRLDISLDFKTEKRDGCYLFKISGLIGGHSGVEINAGRLNAIKLLSEIIPEGAMIGEISGGVADNAIPDYAECKLSADIDLCEATISKMLIKCREKEKNISVTCDKLNGEYELFSKEDSRKIFELIRREHYGPIKISEDIPTLPETSMNLGIIKTEGGRVSVAASIRSSKEQGKREALLEAIRIAEELGFETSAHGDYPGWDFKKDSPLRNSVSDAYKRLYGKEAKTVIIHAGLECGLFSGKIENLDCVSMGPTAYDIHTPEERLSIPSAIRVWRLLLEVLKNFKGEKK